LERKGKEMKENEVKQTYRENLRKVIKLPHDSDTSPREIQSSTRKEAREGDALGRKKKEEKEEEDEGRKITSIPLPQSEEGKKAERGKASQKWQKSKPTKIIVEYFENLESSSELSRFEILGGKTNTPMRCIKKSP
jgi:hypothetical protein